MNYPRVLYVIGSMDVGGAEQHLLAVSAALVRRGARCEVFAIDCTGPLRSSFEAAGVPVLGVRMPRWLMRSLPRYRLLSRIRLALSAPRLLWHLWRHRPQVVHCFLPAAYILGGVVAQFFPKLVCIMSRRSQNLYQRKYPLFGRCERLLHPRMDVICGNSQAVIAELVSEGVRQDQLRLIYNGIDTRRFLDARRRDEMRGELGLPAEALVFVMVANLIPYKGHADLLQALALVRDRLPVPWVCLLVGRDDGIGYALRAQAAALGLGDRVRVLGARSDVVDLVSAADIGLLCSHEEGFSNAILECMAAALPMIVTDVGGNREAVIDGVTGFVVPACSPQRLAEALLMLALDPDRARLGQAGRARVDSLFTIDSCVDAYEHLYRR